MVLDSHPTKDPLRPSTSLDTNSSKSTGLSYPDNYQGTFFILGYGYICNHVAYMAPLEISLHLRRGFPFSQVG